MDFSRRMTGNLAVLARSHVIACCFSTKDDAYLLQAIELSERQQQRRLQQQATNNLQSQHRMPLLLNKEEEKLDVEHEMLQQYSLQQNNQLQLDKDTYDGVEWIR